MSIIHLFILIGFLGLFFVFLLNHYRQLKKAQSQYKTAFIQIDFELQKRNLRIPELIEISKSSLSHERQLLQFLVESRNNASAALQKAASDPSDSESVKKLNQAENELQIALAEFFKKTSIESNLMNRPQFSELLKSEAESRQIISSITDSYNLAATEYNVLVNRFPGSLMTPLMGFKKAHIFYSNPI